MSAPDLTVPLFWCRERESVRLKKEAGTPWPWTNDPILREGYFTNVHREDDRVTRWIDQHIRRPYATHEHLWFLMCVARVINWPPSLKALMREDAWPDKGEYDAEQVAGVLERRQARGEKFVGSAYRDRAETDPDHEAFGLKKPREIAEYKLALQWERRCDLPKSATVKAWHRWLCEVRGRGDFIAYQVCIDLMHRRVLRETPDRETWAACGGGTLRGLNRVYGRPVKFVLSQARALDEIREVHRQLRRALPKMNISLADSTGVMCEVDKYLRVKLGEGKMRRKYEPPRGGFFPEAREF